MAAVAYASQLQKITELEDALLQSPQELAVRQAYQARVEALEAKLVDVPLSLERDRLVLHERSSRYLRSVRQRTAWPDQWQHQPRIRQPAAQRPGGRAALAPAAGGVPRTRAAAVRPAAPQPAVSAATADGRPRSARSSTTSATTFWR